MSTRTRPPIEHLQRRGLVRLERRWDPAHGELVWLNLRPIQWRQIRRQRRQDAGQGQGEENSV